MLIFFLKKDLKNASISEINAKKRQMIKTRLFEVRLYAFLFFDKNFKITKKTRFLKLKKLFLNNVLRYLGV